MGVKFQQLVRFKSPSGQIYYGEIGEVKTPSREDLIGRRVRIYRGRLPWDEDFELTSEEEEITEVRSAVYQARPVTKLVR